MINQHDNPVQWALLVYDLEEAKEHLEALVGQLAKEGRIDEEDYAAQLGHVYAHLNRDWNARDLDRELSDDEHVAYSEFPDDLDHERRAGEVVPTDGAARQPSTPRP